MYGKAPSKYATGAKPQTSYIQIDVINNRVIMRLPCSYTLHPFSRYFLNTTYDRC